MSEIVEQPETAAQLEPLVGPGSEQCGVALAMFAGGLFGAIAMALLLVSVDQCRDDQVTIARLKDQNENLRLECRMYRRAIATAQDRLCNEH